MPKSNITLSGLVSRYGTVLGKQYFDTYFKNPKAQTEFHWMMRYGEEEGRIAYNNYREKLRESKTKVGYIIKYGDVEGVAKYEEKNSKLSVSTRALKKSGKTDEEVAAIQQKHRTNSRITKETLMEKYGEQEGIERWNQRIQKARQSSKRSLDYWLVLCGGDYAKATDALREHQSHTLEKAIAKYGEEEGQSRYKKAMLRRTSYLGGPSNGEKILGRTLSKIVGQSLKKQVRFFLDTPLDYGDGHTQKLIICDFYIPEANLVVEYYGDYWHANPTRYVPSDTLNMRSRGRLTAKEINRRDELKRKALKEQYGVRTLVVWEEDFLSNQERELERITDEINSKRAHCG